MKVPLRPLIALAIIGFTFVTAVRSHTATSAVSQWNRIDVSGTYSVTGTGGNGQYYEGELFIRRQGDVYQLHWNAGNQYDGIGVVNGNVLAVAYTDSDIEPDDCGVVSYRILGNGTVSQGCMVKMKPNLKKRCGLAAPVWLALTTLLESAPGATTKARCRLLRRAAATTFRRIRVGEVLAFAGEIFCQSSLAENNATGFLMRLNPAVFSMERGERRAPRSQAQKEQ